MKNKLRLYLAYWRRQESELHPGKYHVGLILSPKDPRNVEGEAIIYHAVNPIDPNLTQQVWKFDDKKSKARTSKLAGVMLLGKVPPSFDVEKITAVLRNVYVPTSEEAEKSGWRCRHWVLDAMQLLSIEGIIPALSSSVQNLWQIGYSFVEAKALGTDGIPSPTARIPTCDMNGKEIKSEIGPLA